MQMPTLLAEESMVAAERVGVGTGALERADAKKVIRRWQQDAGVSKSVSRRPRPEQLVAVGIGYQIVDRG